MSSKMKLNTKFSVWIDKEKICASFNRILYLFSKELKQNLLKILFWDPGFGIPDPGVKNPTDPGSGSPTLPGSVKITILDKHLQLCCKYVILVLATACISPTRRGQRPGTDARSTSQTSAAPPLLCTSRPRPFSRLHAATPTRLVSSRSLPGKINMFLPLPVHRGVLLFLCCGSAAFTPLDPWSGICFLIHDPKGLIL